MMRKLHDRAINRLRLKLEPLAFLTAEELRLGTSKNRGDLGIVRPASCLPVFEPLSPGADFGFCVLEHQGGRMQYVTPGILDIWRMNAHELFERAMEALARQPDPILMRVAGISLLRGPTMDVRFDLLVPRSVSVIERFLLFGRPDGLWPRVPVVIIPNERTLLMADGESISSLSQLLRVARTHLYDRGDLLSSLALEYMNGTWREFSPPQTLVRDFQWLRHASAMRRHSHQMPLLSTWLNVHCPGDRIAQTFLMESDSGPQCLGIWPRSQRMDAAIRLPQVDGVMLVDGEKSMYASWERVREVMGRSIEDTCWFPIRWRISGFPTERQLREIDVRTRL